MPDDTHRSQYRLPADLYDQLQSAAQASGRSLNAELVARLRETFVLNNSTELSQVIEEAVRRALAKPH